MYTIFRYFSSRPNPEGPDPKPGKRAGRDFVVFSRGGRDNGVPSGKWTFENIHKTPEGRRAYLQCTSHRPDPWKPPRAYTHFRNVKNWPRPRRHELFPVTRVSRHTERLRLWLDHAPRRKIATPTVAFRSRKIWAAFTRPSGHSKNMWLSCTPV